MNNGREMSGEQDRRGALALPASSFVKSNEHVKVGGPLQNVAAAAAAGAIRIAVAMSH
jgi:hypothetical protein